jgi:hypothetical protein
VCPPTPSRLKPVLPRIRGVSVGPASAGKRPVQILEIRGVPSDVFPAKASPTKNPRRVSGTGFSREEARSNTRDLAVCPPDAFPAIASPTKNPRAPSGTGFSREEPRSNTRDLAVCPPTSSRLKPVPPIIRGLLVGPASAGKSPVQTLEISRCALPTPSRL